LLLLELQQQRVGKECQYQLQLIWINVVHHHPFIIYLFPRGGVRVDATSQGRRVAGGC
jgi:hypothetical protein